MRTLFYGMALLITSLLIGACGGDKKQDRSKIEYDTIPATQITIAVEYYFEGDFTYLADAAVLKETATGVNLPVVMDGVCQQVEQAYTELDKQGKPIYGRFRGILKQREKDEEGADNQLVLTQFIGFEPQKKMNPNELLTGTYRSPEETLFIRQDHTYKLTAKNGEGESGKWYLTTDKIVVFASGDRHTLMDIDYATGLLKTKDDSPVAFTKQ